MITATLETIQAIKNELEHIPEEYQKPFNSNHEAIAVLREEYLELEQEIFFGKKQAMIDTDIIDPENRHMHGLELHKARIQKEAIQVAAMAIRIIQELTLSEFGYVKTRFCQCKSADKTGATSAMHCNICGQLEPSETWLK